MKTTQITVHLVQGYNYAVLGEAMRLIEGVLAVEAVFPGDAELEHVHMLTVDASQAQRVAIRLSAADYVDTAHVSLARETA